jgi:steroid delta-isomerase-like uncharacterized protein
MTRAKPLFVERRLARTGEANQNDAFQVLLHDYDNPFRYTIVNEEQNQAVVKRFIEEMWNQRKLDLADELFSPDCITHQLRGGEDSAGAPRTPESVKQEAAGWFAAFPDLKFDVEQMLSAGDHVVTCYTLRGTHTGAWCGVPPTGKSVSVPMFTIHRIRDGKISEDWVLLGTLTFFQQLGLVPAIPDILAAAAKH